jgi:membrane-associated protease RseP (regulator of RpoE activity)
VSEFGRRDVTGDALGLILNGLWYSCTIIAILGAHEMGHYLACRYYNLDATLPFFLPFPLLSISGTLGAVIKIKEPFPTRKALFDIAVAGPLAGFAVLVPLLFYAVHRSTLVTGAPMPPGSINFGEPLLFQLMAWLKFGSVGDQWQLNLHPIGFAAWFGMLATAWNLLPFGQLDGGHLAYATLGDRSRVLSFATVAASIGMCFVSKSWIVMTGMMLAMLYFFGPRHPPVMDEYEPLGRGRHAIAILAVVLFVLCFTPVPIDIVN